MHQLLCPHSWRLYLTRHSCQPHSKLLPCLAVNGGPHGWADSGFLLSLGHHHWTRRSIKLTLFLCNVKRAQWWSIQVSGHRDLDSNPRRAVDWLPRGTSLDPLPQFLLGEDVVILPQAWTEMRTRCEASPLPGAPGMSPQQSACQVGKGPLIGLGDTGPQVSALWWLAVYGGQTSTPRLAVPRVETNTGTVCTGGGGGLVTGRSQHRAGTG